MSELSFEILTVAVFCNSIAIIRLTFTKADKS